MFYQVQELRFDHLASSRLTANPSIIAFFVGFPDHLCAKCAPEECPIAPRKLHVSRCRWITSGSLIIREEPGKLEGT